MLTFNKYINGGATEYQVYLDGVGQGYLILDGTWKYNTTNAEGPLTVDYQTDNIETVKEDMQLEYANM